MGEKDGHSVLSADEVSKHNNEKDLWVVVDNKVWDLTEFAPTHPGGLRGRDATASYSSVHAPSLISRELAPEKLKGALDPSAEIGNKLNPTIEVQKADKKDDESKPPLDSIISPHDFEQIASRTLAPKTWAFYSSAATDLITMRQNRACFDRIMLRPRAMIDVASVDTRTTVLGCETDVPFFFSPAAMAKLVHDDGEKAVARACQLHNVIQTISTQSSYPVEDIVHETSREGVEAQQPFFFQLYVNKDRPKSEELLRQVQRLGIKAIFVTVDAPVPGKREADERAKADEGLSIPSGSKARSDSKGGGYGRIMGRWVDASLTWADVSWLRRHWKGPIVLKGIMTAMDAQLAADHGVDGIIMSNHGGRNLDTAPASILLLLELRKNCPEIFSRLEVFIDGGIRRGADIFKALCLGAKAVGLGRSWLYSLNYGQEVVEKLIELLKDEFETTMRLCGVTTLSQLHPGLINSLDIDHLVPSNRSRL